jgi:hypothetical protein
MSLLAKLRSGYFFVLVLAYEHNTVTDSSFGAFSHVDNSLIHCYATKNWASLSVDEDMTTVTEL